MNSKQRRKAQRFSIRFIMRFGKLYIEHLESWREDPNVTKEQIIKELKTVIKETNLLKP